MGPTDAQQARAPVTSGGTSAARYDFERNAIGGFPSLLTSPMVFAEPLQSISYAIVIATAVPVLRSEQGQLVNVASTVPSLTQIRS